MRNHHVIISGTGRAGTTFLVQLLSHLKLDTGYNYENIRLNKGARAGLEVRKITKTSPYIVKSPWFCDNIVAILNNIHLDYVFMPMRNLQAAAKSREYVVKQSNSKTLRPSQICGGLWKTDNIDDPTIQQDVLLSQVYNLCLSLSVFNIPLVLLNYPKLTQDSNYLYGKLKPILKDISFTDFSSSFDIVVNPDLVHKFNKEDK